MDFCSSLCTEVVSESTLPLHDGWFDYIKIITVAQKCHEKLADKYHPNTVAFYGNGRHDGNGLTWGTVRWEMRQTAQLQPVVPGALQTRAIPRPAVSLPAATLTQLAMQSDSGGGQIVAKLVPGQVAEFMLSGKDSAGDGTVPENSGAAPAKAGVKVVYQLNLDAAGHEGAYRVPMAQQATLHAILSIAKEIPVVI